MQTNKNIFETPWALTIRFKVNLFIFKDSNTNFVNGSKTPFSSTYNVYAPLVSFYFDINSLLYNQQRYVFQS